MIYLYTKGVIGLSRMKQEYIGFSRRQGSELTPLVSVNLPKSAQMSQIAHCSSSS